MPVAQLISCNFPEAPHTGFLASLNATAGADEFEGRNHYDLKFQISGVTISKTNSSARMRVDRGNHFQYDRTPRSREMILLIPETMPVFRLHVQKCLETKNRRLYSASFSSNLTQIVAITSCPPHGL